MTTSATSPEPIVRVDQSMGDGRAYATCPACAGPLDPSLHLEYYDARAGKHVGACYQGCSDEWQANLPHLRWYCPRCGWGPKDACTPPTSRLNPRTGDPIPVAVEDLPW